jgi:hypothetical protein
VSVALLRWKHCKAWLVFFFLRETFHANHQRADHYRDASCGAGAGAHAIRAEFSRLSGIPYTTVKRHFSKYLAAVSACGLAPVASTQRIDTAEFLRDWGEVVRKVAAVPSQHEYHMKGGMRLPVLITRFDGWTNVPSAFLKMVECGGLAGDWSDALEKIRNGPIPTKSGSRWLARWRKAGRSTEMNRSEKRDQPTTTGDERVPVPDKNTVFAPLPPPLLGKKCVTATRLAVFIAETAPTGLQWITRRVLSAASAAGPPAAGRADTGTGNGACAGE